MSHVTKRNQNADHVDHLQGNEARAHARMGLPLASSFLSRNYHILQCRKVIRERTRMRERRVVRGKPQTRIRPVSTRKEREEESGEKSADARLGVGGRFAKKRVEERGSLTPLGSELETRIAEGKSSSRKGRERERKRERKSNFWLMR